MKFKIHNLPDPISLTSADIEKIVIHSVNKMDLNAESCEVICVSDETLRSMHEQYLSDPEFTDVMTFDLGDDAVEGEIYLSIDRIKDNAEFYNVPVNNEFIRTIIHGLLHLAGHIDNTDEARAVMRSEENKYLNSLKSELGIDV